MVNSLPIHIYKTNLKLRIIFINMNLFDYSAIVLFFYNAAFYGFKLFTETLDSFGRKRIIKDRSNDDDYLERYYLFLKDRQTFPFNIFLHKFLKSDDEELHDHPWNFTTLILSGGYWEHTPEGRTWYGPGSVIRKKATDFHRLELDSAKSLGVTTWTLFIPGKRYRQWGFQTKDGWVEEKKYLEQRKNKIDKVD
jgi:hypothetical protein